VLAITLIKEAVDDLKWYKRDKEINEKVYMKMKTEGGEEQVYSQNIRVGDIVKIN
jgi:phospholipid-translocating ATPase